jgi:Holliday junction resolvase RusA-like endonuclease
MSTRYSLAEIERHNAKVFNARMKNETNRKPQSAIIESPIYNEPLATTGRKEENTGRIHVSVVSFRRRLCDVDNLCPKYFIDCLRYAGIIKDDAPEYIALEVSQIKSKTDWTEITIH